MNVSPHPDSSKDSQDDLQGPRRELGKRLREIDRRGADRWRIDRPVYVIVIGFVVMVGWWGYRFAFPPAEPPSPQEAPIPLNELIFGAVQPLSEGRIEITYTFDPVKGKTDPREKFPQHRDWSLERYLPDGSLVGEATPRIYFDGDVLLEFDAKVMKGRTRMHELEVGLQIRLHARSGAEEPSFFQFSVNTVGRALLKHVTHKGARILVDTRVEPLEKNKWRRFAFEINAGELIGRLDGAEVCRAPVPAGPAAPNWKRVGLRCDNTLAVFDNVRIVGRPAKEWIKNRTFYLNVFRKPAAQGP